MTPPASEQVTPLHGMVLVDMLLKGITLVTKERKSDEEFAKELENEYRRAREDRSHMQSLSEYRFSRLWTPLSPKVTERLGAALMIYAEEMNRGVDQLVNVLLTMRQDFPLLENGVLSPYGIGASIDLLVQHQSIEHVRSTVLTATKPASESNIDAYTAIAHYAWGVRAIREHLKKTHPAIATTLYQGISEFIPVQSAERAILHLEESATTINVSYSRALLELPKIVQDIERVDFEEALGKHCTWADVQELIARKQTAIIDLRDEFHPIYLYLQDAGQGIPANHTDQKVIARAKKRIEAILRTWDDSFTPRLPAWEKLGDLAEYHMPADHPMRP